MRAIRILLYSTVVASLCLLCSLSANADSFSFTCNFNCSSPPFEMGGSFPGPFNNGIADGSISFGSITFDFAIANGVGVYFSDVPPAGSVSFPLGGGVWSILDQSNSVLAHGTFLPGAGGQFDGVGDMEFSGDLTGGGSIRLSSTNDGNDDFSYIFSLNNVTVATPEPGTMLLLGVGVLGLAAVKLMKR